jgi:hypothetical protein
MDAQMLRQRRITMPVAIVAFTVIVILAALTAANMLRRTTLQGAATHDASSASSPTRMVATAPWLVPRAKARFLVRRGATSAELAAENEQRWHRLQLQMHEDPWVIGLLRHRPGTTMVDLVGVYLSRR